MKMKVNNSIRRRAKEGGVKLWQIAEHLGVSEPTMTRWLRTPLSSERERVIIEAIEALAKEVEQ